MFYAFLLNLAIVLVHLVMGLNFGFTDSSWFFMGLNSGVAIFALLLSFDD